MPAIKAKTYMTHGLYKPALNERGTLLDTHGFYGDAPDVGDVLGVFRTNLAIKMANFAKHFKRRH
jgi:hypothetical protein